MRRRWRTCPLAAESAATWLSVSAVTSTSGAAASTRASAVPANKKREEWLASYSNHGIALLTGTPIDEEYLLIAIDRFGYGMTGGFHGEPDLSIHASYIHELFDKVEGILHLSS